MTNKTNKSGRNAFVGKALLVTLICILGLATACSNDSTKKETVYKQVAVSFPTYSSGQTNISLAPTYSPDGNDWGEHFSASDITYTVTVTDSSNNLIKTYDSETGFIIPISDGYSATGIYTFTQTFKMSNTKIGVQVIKVEVVFSQFGMLKDSNGNNLPDQAKIPPVNITLSKEVVL